MGGIGSGMRVGDCVSFYTIYYSIVRDVVVHGGLIQAQQKKASADQTHL